MADVAAMPQFTLDPEFRAQKCRRKLGDKPLGGVRFRAKAGREFPLETGLMSTPVSELMQGGRVIALHALERGGRRERDVVLGGDVSCHVSTHTNICQGRRDKGTYRGMIVSDTSSLGSSAICATL